MAMAPAANSVTEASFIEAPRDALLSALYAYWNKARGTRRMPSRSDIDPVEIPKLLPHILMYNVMPDGGFTIRLVGEAVADFVGRNATGEPAGAVMTPRAAEVTIAILRAVVTERMPKFRAGKAHWYEEKSHRDFEACFLPLSSDGETVDIILGGVRFPL
ncbi:MAG TPA: PAS domain-containing protein [Stellaceae bacterium]|nr:PAS domain-containing protein [Stellaceae bacterium]